jgi:hypothetical protein
MSQTQEHPERDPGATRIIQQRHIAGSHGEKVNDGHDDRGRRWYHLRPKPRRRTDVMGLNATWWMLLWLVLIVILVEPWLW